MNLWVEGARPKTLVASVVPVLVGTAAAARVDQCPALFDLGGCHHIFWWRFIAALIVSIAIQIGANYTNDYFDGRRGVDTAARRGPRRLTASGLATHKQMKTAIFTSFFIAAIAGLALALATSLWILAIGAMAFLAALGYSGGPKPYGAAGLGEVFVFLFFGLVATIGSEYVQLAKSGAIGYWPLIDRNNPFVLGFLAAIPVGLLAVCILVVNNLRDIDTDAAAGKRTLAVRLGRRGTRALYRGLILLAFSSVLGVTVVAKSFTPLLALLALSFAVKPTMLVGTREDAPGLVQALIATARLQFVFGVLLSLGLWLR